MKAIICLVLLGLIASSVLASPTTASPTSASFNITPALVFTSANSTATANDAKITQSSDTVYNPLITFGPGAMNTTIYAYAPLFVAATGTGAMGGSLTGVVVRTINANQVVALPGDTTESSVQTADVAVTITATLRGVPQMGSTAAGLGSFAIAGVVAGSNAPGTAPGNIDTLTLWTTSGTSLSQTIAVATATTTSASGPLLTFAVNALWYEDGYVYIVYESQSIPGSFASSAFTASTATGTVTTVSSLSINAFGATNGSKLWTAGATALVSSLGATSSSTAATPITMAIGGGNNFSMSTLCQVVYKTVSASPPTTSVVTVTKTTGVIASGPTVIGTDVTTGTVVTYVPGGIIASNYTYGVLLSNATAAPVDGAMGYLNGSTTAAAATQLAIPTGTNGQLMAKGAPYGTGFGLLIKTPQTTGAAYSLQAYFANGTVNGTAASVGTFQGQVSAFVDQIGALWIGYYTWDTAPAAGVASNGALTGYVGRIVAQTNYYNSTTTKAANVIATFAAILSFVIASLFMF